MSTSRVLIMAGGILGLLGVVAGAMGVRGATLASLGIGIVVVLTLRAMTEWHAGRLQRAARDNHPVS